MMPLSRKLWRLDRRIIASVGQSRLLLQAALIATSNKSTTTVSSHQTENTARQLFSSVSSLTMCRAYSTATTTTATTPQASPLLSTAAGGESTYAAEYAQSIADPRAYWRSKLDLLEWSRRPTVMLDESRSPLTDWFGDGALNACHNCLDVHVRDGHGAQAALIHDSPLTGACSSVSYAQLLDEVARFAGVLARHGVTRGDRVLIYMPMIPQAVVAMLAAARIGAVHSLVFGGFASRELATRITHARPRLVVSANFGVEPGRLVDYRQLLEGALTIAATTHRPHKCIVFNRPGLEAPQAQSTSTNSDSLFLDYTDELKNAVPHDCVNVPANHPLYLLYTSGTTGAPKGVVRSTGGYMLALKNAMRAIYGVRPGETWWAMSDLGWTVGHSFACYGPLANRNTSVLYEGKPVGTPDAGALFRVLAQHSVVSMFVAPTALRAIHAQDPEAALGRAHAATFDKHLRHLFVAGEHCDHDTMSWTRAIVRRPVYDHWWQTETGWPITAMCAGLMSDAELRSVPAGVSGKPVPGYDIRVLRDDGSEADAGQMGRIVIKLPLPPGTIQTLWQNDELFRRTYFSRYPGYYDTADVGVKCADGFVTVMSRADDVINVAGHRLSSSALEEACLEHAQLAECAVVELHDQLKGAVPFGFLVRTRGAVNEASTAAAAPLSDAQLVKQVVAHVRHSIGPVACFKQAVVVERLPKTRSGKLARNTLKAMINKEPFRVPVTIEDAAVYHEIKRVLLDNNYTNVSDPTP